MLKGHNFHHCSTQYCGISRIDVRNRLICPARVLASWSQVSRHDAHVMFALISLQPRSQLLTPANVGECALVLVARLGSQTTP